MAFPLLAIPAALGALGALKGASAQKKQANAAQSVADQQKKMMSQAQPYYGALLQFLAQNAGLQMPQGTPGIAGPQGVPQTQPVANVPGRVPFGAPRMPTVGRMMPAAPNQPSLLAGGGGVPGLPNSALGIYGQGQDALRLQQAEEDVNRLARQRAQMLQYRLGQQGIGDSATLGAALGRNEGDALSQLANFRRNLAINAGTEQQQRMQQLLGALNPGLSGGQQAAGIFQNLAGMSAQQSAQGMGALGDAFSNFFLSKYLRPQRTDIVL